MGSFLSVTLFNSFSSKYVSFVAAQMYEFSYTENPPNCVGGIRELFYCLVIASLLLALLLNTSRSLLLLRINCLVSTLSRFIIQILHNIQNVQEGKRHHKKETSNF
jgi:hypothetical protein